MPPPFAALSVLARCEDHALADAIAIGTQRAERRHFLYELLRREQAIAASGDPPTRAEPARILDFAQAAYGDLVGVLCGRDDSLLESARDAEWTLRDILRHAIAVELRYAAQVAYSASRGERDPVAIPPALLPCDRLAPPEPEYAATRSGGIEQLVALLGKARARSDASLSTIADAALARPSMWVTLVVDVRTRMHQIAAHLVETTVQIEKTVDMRGEARAILRRCCAARGRHAGWSAPDARSALDDLYEALAAASQF